MTEFKQKWAIVALLEDVLEGSEFHYSEFPVHITLAGVFATDKDGEWLSNGLRTVMSEQKSVVIQAGQKAMFGSKQDVPVVRIKQTKELLQLYQMIYQWLDSTGVTYNEPDYQGAGYVPHSTIQKNASLRPGETRELNSVSLIDLFPNHNGYQRKISATIELQ